MSETRRKGNGAFFLHVCFSIKLNIGTEMLRGKKGIELRKTRAGESSVQANHSYGANTEKTDCPGILVDIIKISLSRQFDLPK